MAAGGGFGEVGGEGTGFFIAESEVGHLDGGVVLLRIFEEGDESSAFEFGCDVVERDASVVEVGLEGVGLGVAGDAAEVVEDGSAVLGEGEVGRGADFLVGSDGGEVGSKVGCCLGTFGFGVIDHGGHGGGGLQFFGLGNPAGEPGLVGAVADVGKVGAGILQFWHGIFSEVVSGVALDTVVTREKMGGIDGGIRHCEGLSGDCDTWEFTALFPEKTEGSCSGFERGVGDFNWNFAGVDADPVGDATSERNVFAVDFKSEIAFDIGGEGESVALGDVEGAFVGGGKGSGSKAGCGRFAGGDLEGGKGGLGFDGLAGRGKGCRHRRMCGGEGGEKNQEKRRYHCGIGSWVLSGEQVKLSQ